MSDKPFAPTAQRLRKARADGDVPKAQELATIFSFLGVFVITACAMGGLVTAAASCLLQAITLAKSMGNGNGIHVETLMPYVARTTCDIGVAFGVGGGISCVIALCATGAKLTPVSLKLERLSPLPQLRNLVGPTTVMALLRATVGAALAGAVLLPLAIRMIAASVGIRRPTELAAGAWQASACAVCFLACIGVAIAGIEVFVSLRKRNKKLRMSYDELRREAKEQAGDPHVRQARKRRHRSLMRGSISAVRKATVVVTNPTHLAIALIYDPPGVTVPRVLISSADEHAARVRAAAREAGVPCIEHVALARRLWAECDEGDAIPLDTYAIVAPIIVAAMRVAAKQASS